MFVVPKCIEDDEIRFVNYSFSEGILHGFMCRAVFYKNSFGCVLTRYRVSLEITYKFRSLIGKISVNPSKQKLL